MPERLTNAPEEAEEPEERQEEPEEREEDRAHERGTPEGPADRRKAGIFLGVLLAMVAAYVAVFLTLSLLRYSNFRGSGLDTAIYNQVIWLFSRFKAPVSTLRGMHFFGDHLSPMLVLLAPLGWLGKGKPPAVLTVQTLALAAGAIPVYLLSVRKLHSRWAGLGLAAAYLLYPALQNLNLADFHPEALGTVFLLFAFLAIDKRSFGWFYALCVLTVITKEDMALPVLVLGIVVYFLYDKRAGAMAAIGSAVYFLAAVLLLIPWFAPAGYQYSSRLTAFGSTTGEAVKNFFLKPRNTLGVIATRENLRYFFDLLAPVAFLSFFAPVFLLPALPAFLVNVISDFQPQHTIFQQYTVAIIPFVFIAVVFGLKRFGKWSEGAFRPGFVTGGVVAVVLACSIAGNFYLSPSPISAEFRGASYGSDRHITAMRRGLDRIPPNASVSAQTYLLAHLSNRRELYQFPEPFRYLTDVKHYNNLGRMLGADQKGAVRTVFPKTYRTKDRGAGIAPEYVIVDSGSTCRISTEMYDQVVEALQARGGYVMIYGSDGVKVFRKAHPARRSPGGGVR